MLGGAGQQYRMLNQRGVDDQAERPRPHHHMAGRGAVRAHDRRALRHADLGHFGEGVGVAVQRGACGYRLGVEAEMVQRAADLVTAEHADAHGFAA